MMLRLLVSTLLLVVLSLIQTTWLSAIAVLGAKPDLGLLAVVWLSYRTGPVIGTSSAFLSGLVDDAISAAPLGFSAFIKSLVAWASSFLHGSLQLDHILMPMALGAATTLAKGVVSLFLFLFFRGAVEAYDLLSSVFWVEVAYNALVAPLLFAILQLLFRALEPERRDPK